MNSLSTGVLLSGARRIGDFADPLLFRLVVNLRIRFDRFEQPEAVRILRSASHVARHVVEIAKPDRLRGAGFATGGRVLGKSLAAAGLLGGVPAAVTEIALLDDPAHARRDVG